MPAPEQHPHLDHLFKVGVLYNLATNKKMPATVRVEAQAELDRYRQEGLYIQKQRQEHTMAKKQRKAKEEPADEYQGVWSGKGVLFVVIDDREGMLVATERRGSITTISIITDAIEAALDAGLETSEEIARHLCTTSFQHIPDKRVRFNTILMASDRVGAQMTRKIYNAYNELAEAANEPDLTPAEKRIAKAEATGFAEATSIMLSPFSCEDPSDARLVDWDMVDHITGLFEKEQTQVRRARNGKPQ